MLSEILAEVAAGKFRPLYLLFGVDPVFTDELISRLKEKLLAPGLELFDYESINGDDIRGDSAGIALVLQRVRQVPVASVRRLVLIRHLERLERKALERLGAGLAQLPDTTTVVAICAYSRELTGVWKKAGLGEWVIAQRKSATGAAELARLINHWARANQLTFEPAAVTLLLEVAGEDTALLKGEVDKLATVLGPGGRVTPELVRQYASSTKVFELREFVNLVAQRRVPLALRVLRRLEALGEEPITIIAWLTHALMDILRVKAGLMSPAALWRVPRDTPRLWTGTSLDRALNKLYQMNVAILQGYAEPFALLDMWTLGIARTPLPLEKRAANR